jgi:hypothetical protein
MLLATLCNAYVSSLHVCERVSSGSRESDESARESSARLHASASRRHGRTWCRTCTATAEYVHGVPPQMPSVPTRLHLQRAARPGKAAEDWMTIGCPDMPSDASPERASSVDVEKAPTPPSEPAMTAAAVAAAPAAAGKAPKRQHGSTWKQAGASASRSLPRAALTLPQRSTSCAWGTSMG